MNPVLILSRNTLELTKRAVESASSQDVPVDIYVYDNGSTDGSVEWLKRKEVLGMEMPSNYGVSHGWNIGLHYWFVWCGFDHVLVLNSDTEIPPYFYRTLLDMNLPFVTGASVMERDHPCPELLHPYPAPDFSAFLIRRNCWEIVGQFDESMKLYASDNDYHVRAHLAGITLMNSGVPFYHERSSTLKNATPEDRNEIEMQADRDRAWFKAKWGCEPWEPAYAELFTSQSLSKAP